MAAAGPTVFWICGASGVGKSVAAWALFERLAADGVRVAYVDIDQLGMLYPAGSDDRERHLLKAEALLALVPGYASAGAQVLVVSGVVDTVVGPDPAMAAEVDLTLCLLLADPATLRQRILARQWDEGAADAVLADNAVLHHASFVDAVIDTAGLSVAATVERLRVLVSWVESASAPTLSIGPSPADVGVVMVTGSRAAGSSTVGFGLAMARWSGDLRTGFVDLQQLAFFGSPGSAGTTDAQLAIVQLATMHAFLAARGAGLMVVSGHLDVVGRRSLRDALPRAAVTVVRLRADVTTLKAHVDARAVGSGARLAGDDLLDAGPSYRATLVEESMAEQERLDASACDDGVVDVSDRTAADAVAEVERLIAARTR
jgi:broad-specificity NMP kinase